jgi:L,D-peptidoglycan transpeptidase YkuD (ErfK/YbiS/YcfS/YnhG family)
VSVVGVVVIGVVVVVVVGVVGGVVVVDAVVDGVVGAIVARWALPHAASRLIVTATSEKAVGVRGRRIVLRLSMVRRALLAAIALFVSVAGCGSSKPHASSNVAPSTVVSRAATRTTRPLVRTTTSTAAPTAPRTATSTATSTRPQTTVAPAAPQTTVAAGTTVAPAKRVVSLAQEIVVSASAYGSSYATLSAYDMTAGGWVRRFGPWTARVGRNGFARVGAKREGDGRTPSGTYGFSFFFGISANPGVAFPYRQITSSSIVWDDDPASANYNEWIDTRAGDAGVHPEPMRNAPFYDYGAVIAYNTSRTPGLGSAIFLHVSDGGSTAGCVALPVDELLQILRWLNPTHQARIRMGVGVDVNGA